MESSSTGLRIPTTLNHVLPEVDHRRARRPVDLEDAGRLGAEHHLGVAGAHGVEEVAGGHRRAHAPAGRFVAGGVDADPAGLLRRARTGCGSTVAPETW